MKKILATLMFLFSMLTISGLNAFACTEGVDCPIPVAPTTEECLSSGTCNGGFVSGSASGQIQADAGMNNPNKLWAEECGNLTAATAIGAPESGQASLDNTVTRLMSFESFSPDGNSVTQIQDLGQIKISSEAADGSSTGGFGAIQNVFAADMKVQPWESSSSKGIEASLNTGLNMKAMGCAADGTSTLVTDKVVTNVASQFSGNGMSLFQQNTMNGSITVDLNKK